MYSLAVAVVVVCVAVCGTVVIVLVVVRWYRISGKSSHTSGVGNDSTQHTCTRVIVLALCVCVFSFHNLHLEPLHLLHYKLSFFGACHNTCSGVAWA